ncbi:MAG: DsbA family oxidoreductase [Nitratireductor sp.]
MKTVKIDIVSDVMCPWCYVGKKHLESALDLVSKAEPDLDVQINWRPFLLDATLPKEGKDRQQYLSDKFGSKERAKEIYSNIEQAGSNAGLKFEFDKIKVSPNTVNAHRLILWAGNISANTQDTVVTRLFDMFFMEGKNVGDTSVLLEAAKDAGMNIETLEEKLNSDEDVEHINLQLHEAQQMGVSGVPFFIFDMKYALSGAQPPEALAKAIQDLANEA